MSSGISASPECLHAFQQLKYRHLKYITFALDKSLREIIVDKTGNLSGAPNTERYEEFTQALRGSEGLQCRYGVFDFEYNKGDEGKRSKICFFSWSPDGARIKDRMVYSSSKDALRKSLLGVAVDVQGTDVDEIDYSVVMEKAGKGH